MKRIATFILLSLILLLWSSCRKELDFETKSGGLAFSKDTVYLDTVFTNIGSSTYNLKVYNRSDDDISIPSVRLALGESSEYRLNVDGVAGKEFQNVEILANDSMYVFVETTIDINNLPNTNGEFLYTDEIEFGIGTNMQTVDLVTLVKDAHFIYPDRDNTTGVIETLTLNVGGEQVESDIQGRYLLPEELTFTNEKPYVVYGFAAVPNGETLTINAGTRVHFHADSGLLVSEGASLHINGELSNDEELLENEVILEGDRLEPSFSEVPGQWGTIWLFEGSVNNTINYTTIKNASVGILSDGNPDEANDKLTITNSQIYNSSNYGILGRNTSILAENLVINNTGLTSFAGTLGGKYNFTHCTITNYWSNSFRQFPALLLNNFQESSDGTLFLADLTEANFNNCIIYGNDNPEFLLDEVSDNDVSFNFKFTNSLLRFEDPTNSFNTANYNFNDTSKYEGNIFNDDPAFLNAQNNQMRIGEGSAAINLGDVTFAAQVPEDISGENRTTAPDAGAYQYIGE
ncbi:right-handed parallel beta-helix repeat-containing protein [Mangrovimonas spongiae]|uniref:Right-handed parallel beta-helix repeat-containing protein n=1 Tax=Mangrovimonas spongiae TaxID=2494697 RepID=A0A428JVW9_9FLAO|nr:hypothetical protein [Mangrovimonas spongiae]RSK38258.1 hypothetical protein EJA19_12240 [Mangrovimonas spongiae]